MRSLLPILSLGLAACGGNSDKCQQFVDKSRPVLEKTMSSAGKTLTADQATALVKQCRDRGGNHGKDQALFDCVIGASGQPAVAACWEAGMKGYADTAKSGGSTSGGTKLPSERRNEIVMNRLVKGAKIFFAENGAFPEGAAPLTPDCCAQPNHRCDATTIPSTGIWAQLDLASSDEHHVQLSYEGTKTSFMAKGFADTDCDEEKLEYTITGKVENNGPVVEMSVTGKD